MLFALVFTTLLHLLAPPETLRVVVEPDSLDLLVAATGQLSATAYDDDGTRLSDVAVRWFSSDSTIATVDGHGQVTALQPGHAQIAALVQGTVGFASVHVRQLPPARVTASLAEDVVPVGVGIPLNVTVQTRRGDPLLEAEVTYATDMPSIATVDASGRIVGLQVGSARVIVTSGEATTSVPVEVVANPAETYELTADLVPPVRTGDVIRFHLAARTPDGSEMSGLYPVWMTGGAAGAQIEAEGNDGVFVAERPGTYTVSALIGPDLVRSLPVTVEPRRYEAELIRVGRGPVADHHSGDTWVFEGVDGRDYAYIGTFMHDWMKVWDVTEPAHPVLTDSMQADARRINDVKIHPNNRLAVITREGASDRRNGIILLDLSTPPHPTILSEYTETVTGGVHNVWIDGTNDLIYACHNGTNDLHIIDISDPTQPNEVGRWGLDKENKVLHDVIVQEGYAYLSYWDDGVVMLDVGAGTHGGTPTEPAFVSQYLYPEGNTHVAWRYGRYLFVGDEIFPADWNPAKADAPIDARGYVHVLDLTDPDHPYEVARYEVPEAGAHNVWVEDDKLYVGYYQGGLRVVDVSGELRGDLYRQGREIATLKTTDAQTTVPNWPMTWGAQVFKGHIFTSDLNSGLWIARLVEKAFMP